MRILLVPVVLAAFAAPAAAQLEGAFTLSRWDKDTDGRVHLNLVYNDGHSNYGRMVERSALTDVVRTGERITFALRREPGTFTFEGAVRWIAPQVGTASPGTRNFASNWRSWGSATSSRRRCSCLRSTT